MRADAYRQYLKPVIGRSNLTVVTGARTLRIEFESGRAQPVARGVHFAVSGPDGARHSGAYIHTFLGSPQMAASEYVLFDEHAPGGAAAQDFDSLSITSM